MICPFLKDVCCEDECGMYDIVNERCSFLLIAEIMASKTDEYRIPGKCLKCVPAKVVNSDD